MTKHLTTLTLAALMLALPAAAQDEQTTNLQPQWQQGQTAQYNFWYRKDKTEAANVLGQSRSETTVFQSEGLIRWTIEEVRDDGSAACVMHYESIRLTITGTTGQEVVVDSANPTGEVQLYEDLIAAILRTPLTVVVNADGTIDSLDGIDALNAAAGQELVEADAVPDENDFLETASDLAVLIAAPADATPGQTWSTQNTWNHENILPGAETQADWDTTFTFESVGRIEGVPIATIATESDIEMEVDLSELAGGQLEVDVRFNSASSEGEILYDLSRGEAVARNANASYSADIILTAPQNPGQAITVRVTEQSQSQLLRVSEE